MSKEGPKKDNEDFANILQMSTIFCLQETKQEFFMSNYKCFNSNRPKSRSGGVCTGIHRSIADQAVLVKTGCPDFQAITMFHNDPDKRFTIVNVHDSPEQSSYKAKLKAKNTNQIATESTLVV